MNHHDQPAFPRPAGWNGMSNYEELISNESQDGMSLLDYFAAVALPFAMKKNGVYQKGGDLMEQAAKMAYDMADAMLAERLERKGS